MTREEIKRLADDYSELSGELGFASGRRRAEVLRPMVAEARAALHAAIDAMPQWREQLAAVVDIWEDGVSFAPGEGCYASGSLREIMLASKAMLSNPTAPSLQGAQAPTPSPSQWSERCRIVMSNLLLDEAHECRQSDHAAGIFADEEVAAAYAILAAFVRGERSGLADSARAIVEGGA